MRFLPLLAGLVCLYAIGKELHLSPLIIVLVLRAPHQQPASHHVAREAARAATDDYEQTLKEFKGLVAELTFATKSFFFLLLGYWTDVQQMLSVEAWLVAVAGIAIILASRWRDPEAAAAGRGRAAGVDRAARPHHGAPVPDRARHRQARRVSRSAR